MKLDKTIVNISFLALVALCVVLSIWGPEALTGYQDKAILNQAHTETAEAEGEGYRYSLSRNERLYILSECLNSQVLPESDLNSMTRTDVTEPDYQELTGSYAFIVNHRGPSGREITDEEIYATCNDGLDTLKELGILPESVEAVEAFSYDAVLYSAIDILEPRNNMAVWKISLSGSQKNASKNNRLIDAYVDADDGKIYEFYVRTPLTWEEIDTDDIISKWSGYMGLTGQKPYESENPLSETTPYFKKYVFDGMGEDKTIVTIGFYEGINEIFLKISK